MKSTKKVNEKEEKNVQNFLSKIFGQLIYSWRPVAGGNRVRRQQYRHA